MVDVCITAEGEPALAKEREWIERFKPIFNRENTEYSQEPAEDDDLVEELVDLVSDVLPF